LRRRPAASAPELAADLRVSVPTVQRLLRGAGDAVITLGRARRTRHAWRRGLRGQAADLPVYRVDEDGVAQPFAALALVAPQGTAMALEGGDWPLPDESRDGWWPGLPYLLQDMRPQGYMSRQFARAVHEGLQLPMDPRAWSDDEVLLALAQAGWDMPGDLIVGEAAMRRWQAGRLNAPEPLDEDGLAQAYVALAEQAVAGGGAGSSAAGEFPKFAALRAVPQPDPFEPGEAARTPHVLVKFSGAGDTPAERRWADLLLAEHLALQALAGHGLPAARSRLAAGGRTFLEVERFDRHGRWGRSPLVSLEAVNAAFLGLPHRAWPELAAPLARAGVLAEGAQTAIAKLWWFGRLIDNTDMHPGNLSFQPQAGRLALAPAYDMLPMRHAPLTGGEVPRFAVLEPPLPLPTERAAWRAAARAALQFWEHLAQDRRASGLMQSHADASAARLREGMAVVG
jgi:hypothetical protein